MARKNIYERIKRYSEVSYNVTLVSRKLLRLKFGNPDENRKNKLMLALFLMSSKLFVKAINNYHHLIQTANVEEDKILHTDEDIISECYITMNSCVKNLKAKDVKKYYYYLNISLNRAIYRLVEKNYGKHKGLIRIEQEEERKPLQRDRGYDDHFDLTIVDLKDLSAKEIDVVNFKFSGEKLNVFLKKTNMTSSEYYEVFEEVKHKIANLYPAEMKALYPDYEQQS